MSYSKDLLKSKDNELYKMLESAWELAEKEISSVLQSADESLNSLPHSRNLENYLDSILIQCTDVFNEASEVYFTPHELFCLLMSILLHDIGRIKFEPAHGTFSRHYIIENYIRLGLKNDELAEAVAAICEFHKPAGDRDQESSIIILDGQGGKIRIRALAELLVLLDEMDTTFRRLKPLWVLDQDKYNTGKGIFRYYIKGVRYDLFTQAVYVSLDNKLIENTSVESLGDCNFKVVYKEKVNGLSATNADIKGNETGCLIMKLENEAKSDFAWAKICYNKIISSGIKEIFPVVSPDLINNILTELRKMKIKQERTNSGKNEILDSLLNDQVVRDKGMSVWLFRGSKAKIEEKNRELIKNQSRFFFRFLPFFNLYRNNFSDSLRQKIMMEAGRKWPLVIVLALIQRSIAESQAKFNNLIYLNRLGLNVRKWLIVYKDHLYNPSGTLTVEPVLSRDDLETIAYSMLNLCKPNTEAEWHSYSQLLSASVKGGNIGLTKLAVARLDVFFRDYFRDKNLNAYFNYNNSKWILNLEAEKDPVKRALLGKLDLCEILKFDA
jgi:hypothetical protein